MLSYILLFTFGASIASLFLVSLLLLKGDLIKKLSFRLVSFAAGALLANGFTDTLPEAVSLSKQAFLYTTLFIAVFFLIERVFLHLHHHEAEEGQPKLRVPISFLMFGDALHNFIDGVAIASTFLVSVPLGILTSAAIFVHEIPHELGDFGILIHMGFKKKVALLLNGAAGLVAMLGAVLGYSLGNRLEGALPILLSLTSANFIYLSLSDLLPEIHEKTRGRAGFSEVLFFLCGVGFIILLGTLVKE